MVVAIGVRGGGSGAGWAAATPCLKIFRANSVFRASASCSKILNDKKYIFTIVNSGHPLFFRVSACCSKILNVKSILNRVKNSRATVFQGKRKSLKNCE